MHERSTQTKDIGNRIKAIRIHLGLTMEDFGKLVDPKATKGTVSNWERGNYLPNNARLKQIADLGEVSLVYLLQGKIMIRDTHMLPEEDRNELKKQQRESFETFKLDLKESAQKSLNSIDYENLPFDQLVLLNQITRFINNYNTIDDSHFIVSIASILTQLNEIYDYFTDKSLSKKEKMRAIEFYITDLSNESPNIYSELATYLKSKLN